MIGRRITDQTVTCKVIKPINYNKLISQLNSSNSQSNQKINENNQFTTSRLFGISSQNVVVDVDFQFAMDHENQLNRINKIRQMKEDQQKREICDNKGQSSRIVTQYFITNKNKPASIEVKKNVTTAIMQQLAKKQQINTVQTEKTEDNGSLKSTKISKKAENKMQKNIQGSESWLQQKTKTQAQTYFQGQVQLQVNEKKNPNNASNVIGKKTQKQIKSAFSHNKINQMPKQNKKQPYRQNNRLQSNKQPKSTISTTHKLSSQFTNMMKNSSIQNHKSIKILQTTEIFQKQTEQNQMSFRAWQETPQQQLIDIQNYQPNISSQICVQKDYNLNLNNKNLLQDQSYKNQPSLTEQKKQTHQPNQNVKQNKQKQKQKNKPTTKIYLSVKQEIELKLKEKKERLKTQTSAKQKKSNKFLIKSQKSYQTILEKQKTQKESLSEDQHQQQDQHQEQVQQQEENQHQEERTVIPQPIKKAQTQSQTKLFQNYYNEGNPLRINQQEQNEFLSGTQSFQHTFQQQLQRSDLSLSLKENQNKFPADFFEKNSNNQKKNLKYNYIESSEDQRENQIYAQKQLAKNKNCLILNQQNAGDTQLDGESQFRFFEQYEDYQTIGHYKKFDNKTHIKRQIFQPSKRSQKPVQIDSQGNKNTQLQKQKFSSQQEEQQDNPRLQEYLKKNKLISSAKKQRQKIEFQYQKSRNEKVSQLLNNYLLPVSTGQVIHELDEQYLQSSVFVKDSCLQPYQPGKFQCKLDSDIDDLNVDQSNEFQDASSQQGQLQSTQNQLQSQERNRVYLEDSSDSEQNHPLKHSNLPPFLSTRNLGENDNTKIDQLFCLNLESLLKKQFIVLSQSVI